MQFRIKSRSATVVILQHATESLTAFDLARDDFIIDRLNQFIAQSLMVSLLVIVFDVFMHP